MMATLIPLVEKHGTQTIVTGLAIRFGACRCGLDQQENILGRACQGPTATMMDTLLQNFDDI
jgi:hypothetical protein